MAEAVPRLRFLADENVHTGVITWMRGNGYDTLSCQELGLTSASDHEILDRARADGRVLLTFDLDFGEILQQPGGAAGIIILRLWQPKLVWIIERLRQVLPLCAAALAAGAIVTIEDGRHRVRNQGP